MRTGNLPSRVQAQPAARLPHLKPAICPLPNPAARHPFSIVAMNIDRIGIVGTGLAGLRVAAELREAGFSGALTAWNAEGCPPYDRPPLSKNLLDAPLRPLADEGFGDLADLDVDVVPRPAEHMRPEGEGWFIDGFDVDVAVIASGSRPCTSIPGALTLYTVDDSLRIADSLANGARVDIVGAGWVGTELASIASDICEVHLWESSPHVLGRTFDGAVDDLWISWIADAGVILHLGQTWPGNTRPGTAVAESALVQATGSVPVFPRLGLEVDVSPRGALVTDMHTRVLRNGRPVSGLYAVGDCADATTPFGPRNGGHWMKALADGAFTAAAIFGGTPPRFLAPPEVFSTQFGKNIGFVGAIPECGLTGAPGETDVERIDTAEGVAISWSKEGKLIALLAVDSPRELARARKSLRIKL